MFKLIKQIKENNEISKPRLERKIKVSNSNLNLFVGYFKYAGFFKKYPDKIINSIYFDDKNLNFAKSNINGELYRIKPRLRWYDDSINNINHEFKIKVGFDGFKSILRNIFPDDKLLKDKIKLTKKIYKNNYNLDLEEVLSIRYKRSYYEHPSGIRLTIDKNIISTRNNYKRFFLMPYEVIEFKYEKKKDIFFRDEIFSKFNNLPLIMNKC